MMLKLAAKIANASTIMPERNLKTTLIQLLQEHHLLSAKTMLDLLGKQGRKFNKTSVYRALDQLIADGTACEHHFVGDEAVYELAEHHHTHLVCRTCGKIQTAACDYHAPTTVNGFVVNHHHVTLMGTCAECAQRVVL
jgi:Fe2+ or Zn2+ uptake regulation protein